MSRLVKNKDGKEITLYSPMEKGKKYANDLKQKADSVTGEPLTDTQASWRAGYLKARKDSAKMFKWQKKKEAAGKWKNNKKG